MRRHLIAGVGLQRGCDTSQVVAVVRAAMGAVGEPVAALAAPSFKRNEAGLIGAARLLEIELLFIEDRLLHAAQRSCVSFSAVAERAVGFASVAEASALAAAGADAHLVLPRIRGQGATCAIAERR